MNKKRSHPILRFFFNAVCSTLIIVSCDDDNHEILFSVIQFSATLQNVSEGEEVTILLTLDKPAPDNTSVELNFETNAIYSQHFVTDPSVSDNTIVLQIGKGEKSAEFKIATFDNEKFEGTKFIVFQIKSPSDNLHLGEITVLTLTIGDDEGPSLANFSVNLGTLHEGEGNGILVEIPFSAPAKGEGSLTVVLKEGTAVNGTHFTIDQELTNNTFSFNVVKNSTGAKFRVFPLDNDLFTANLFLSFSIADVSGVVQKGNSVDYSLRLIDDELPSFARFQVASADLAETDSDGVVVELSLSSPVKGVGEIGIALSAGEAVYGRDFTTLPEMIGSKITLSLTKDQTYSSFTVFPKDDDLLKGEVTARFLINSVGGVVRKASDNNTFELTLVDDEAPSIASFNVPSATIDEIPTEGIEVQIQFSTPAAGTGKIEVDVTGYISNFTSQPEGRVTNDWSGSSYSYIYYDTYHITLDVAQNAENARFKILPRNHSQCTKDGRTTFSITDVSGVIRKGENNNFDLTVKRDEPAIVTLNEKESTLNENEPTGKEIILSFSKPPPGNGSMRVSTGYYGSYEERYTTVPEMFFDSGSFGSWVDLSYTKEQNSVAFKVFPVSDNVPKADITEVLHITGPRDTCLEVKDATYTLTIIDDD